MSREKRQEGSWTKPAPSAPQGPPAPKQKNHRRHLRFEIDEASALLTAKGFLSAVGLRRSTKGLGVMNLSESGVLLVSERKIAQGKKVGIRIEMSKYRDTFEADGVVRWSVASRRQGRGYYLGVEFIKLDSVREKKLAQMRDWFTSREYRAKNASRQQGRLTEFRFGDK